MPRPALSQLAVGTLAVVATTVALLALSGAQSVLAITLMVLLCLALGTVTAARRGRHSPAEPKRPRSRRPAPTAETRLPHGRTQAEAREPERVAH